VVCVPEVALLAQIRADFSLPWSAVEAFERGGPALDTATAEAAAREVGLAEDRLAYSGQPVGTGFLEDPGSPRIRLGDWSDPARVIADLVGAVETLDRLTVPGPLRDGPVSGSLLRLSCGRESRLSGASPHEEHHRRCPPVPRDAGRGRALLDARRRLHPHRRRRPRTHDRDALHLFCVETLAPQTLDPDAVCVLEGTARAPDRAVHPSSDTMSSRRLGDGHFALLGGPAMSFEDE